MIPHQQKIAIPYLISCTPHKLPNWDHHQGMWRPLVVHVFARIAYPHADEPHHAHKNLFAACPKKSVFVIITCALQKECSRITANR